MEMSKEREEATPAPSGNPRRKRMSVREVQEKAIVFWATALVENGEDAIGCLSASRPNGGFTNKEILEYAVKNKELEGYGNPVGRFMEYLESEELRKEGGGDKGGEDEIKARQSEAAGSVQLSLFNDEKIEDVPALPLNNGFMVVDTEYACGHLLQLSYIIVSPEWKEKKVVNRYFAYPENIENGFAWKCAIKENGLTKEFIDKQELYSTQKTIAEFFEDMAMVDIVVGHNVSADMSVINGNSETSAEWAETFCTYKDHNSPYSKLKLKELAKELDVEYLTQCHGGTDYKDSLVDCRVTMECFKKLYTMGYVFSPEGELLRHSSKHRNRLSRKPVDCNDSFVELNISDDCLAEYDFADKRFIVSGTTSQQKEELKSALPKLGAKWISSISGTKASADVLIVGEDFTPGIASKKYYDAVQRQQEHSDEFVVFTCRGVEEYLRSKGVLTN